MAKPNKTYFRKIKNLLEEYKEEEDEEVDEVDTPLCRFSPQKAFFLLTGEPLTSRKLLLTRYLTVISILKREITIKIRNLAMRLI